jgi:hypothetical protein
MIEVGKWYRTTYDQAVGANAPEPDDYVLILRLPNWGKYYSTYNLTFYKSTSNLQGSTQNFLEWQIKSEVKSRARLDKLWKTVASDKMEVRKIVRRIFK